MDFFEKVGILAIASRLRRLTDKMSADDVKIYKLFELDFKHKWFPLFATLMDDAPHAVTSIAKETGLSHSSISVMAKEMQDKGLLTITQSSNDARRTELRLTGKSKEMIPAIRKMMLAGEISVGRILSQCHQNLWIALDELEKCLEEQSLYDRVKAAKEELEQIIKQ